MCVCVSVGGCVLQESCKLPKQMLISVSCLKYKWTYGLGSLKPHSDMHSFLLIWWHLNVSVSCPKEHPGQSVKVAITVLLGASCRKLFLFFFLLLLKSKKIFKNWFFIPYKLKAVRVTEENLPFIIEENLILFYIIFLTSMVLKCSS